MGEFGYILFPDVESDVLKSFGSDNSFMNFARLGMSLVSSSTLPSIFIKIAKQALNKTAV